jgi:outer membrane protein OmpA-like peptidoglycan-associated protein
VQFHGSRRIKMKLRLATGAAAIAFLAVSGCATKNWVNTQTAPVVDKTNNLEDRTAENNRNIQDVNARATAGIQQAQNSANSATQSAQSAQQASGQAETAANDAVHRADSLDSVVKNLDNYKSLADVSVNFGFDKAMLTKDDKEQLDGFAGQLGSAKGYILEVTGGTDSTGSAEYNYDLSNRRADAVVQYLASKYNVPAHKFYLIGIGKDQEVAPNNTADGRRKNRRVQIRLLSNMGGDNTQQPAPNPGGSY